MLNVPPKQTFLPVCPIPFVPPVIAPFNIGADVPVYELKQVVETPLISVNTWLGVRYSNASPPELTLT